MSQSKCLTCGADVLAKDNFCRNCGAEIIWLGARTETHQTFARADRRVPLGTFLAFFGGIVGFLSYLMGIVPMLAFGLAALLVGIMILYLPESESLLGSVATDSIISLLLNLENLLADLDLDETGIYIPASGLGVPPKVFVPLALTPATKSPPLGLGQSHGVFVTVGKNPEDRGVLLDAPGAWIVTALERSLHVDFARAPFEDLKVDLDFGFKALGIGRVVSLERRDATVEVEVELRGLADLETKLRDLTPRLSTYVGTPAASAVAASLAKATGRYVMMKSAVFDLPNRRINITIELST